MTSPHIRDIKPFVPARDFELSRRFYTSLGFTENFAVESLAEFEAGDARFFLQNFYVEQWASNSMLYIDVDDAGAWYGRVQELIASGDYPGIRATPPRQQDYGAVVSFVWDPSGVLLHFAQVVT
ncbi:MAG: glyoxalase [marine bacterium B5-7]|nr:MAG: glyoxalase [marine bacterium B5-7]